MWILQDALSVLATAIGKIGLTVGVVCFVVLFVRRASAAPCCLHAASTEDCSMLALPDTS